MRTYNGEIDSGVGGADPGRKVEATCWPPHLQNKHQVLDADTH